MKGPHLLLAALILLLALGLGLGRLRSEQRLHPDEAYFLSFARLAAVQGEWLLPGDLDKPPLAIYLNALALRAFAVDTDAQGVLYLLPHKGEFAARISGAFGGLLLLALLMQLCRRLTKRVDAALLCGLAGAVSPYFSAFAPSAFLDIPMMLFSAASAAALLSRRVGWAAVFALAAFASKPQALYYAPLLLALLLMIQPRMQQILRGFLLAPLGLALLWLWDMARPETSVFILGLINNQPETLPVTGLAARLLAWLDLMQWLAGPALLTALMTLGLIPARRLGWLIGVWALAYSLLHILGPLNLYDRYVLLMLPPLVIGLGAGLAASRWRGLAALLLMAGTMWPLSYPIGGDQGEHDGIDRVADYLNEKAIASVIYDRWLGWELGYYMGPWTNKRRVYYPTPAALAAGAASLDEQGTRYFIAPLDVNAEAWLQALAEMGFSSRCEIQIMRFRVYALSPPGTHARQGAELTSESRFCPGRESALSHSG